jgi:ribonuclease III
MTSLKELEKELGVPFREIRWLDKALTHKSFVHQSNGLPMAAPEKWANEVLEFLGDAVLTLAVSHLLVQTFPEAHEGFLSLRRSHLVKRSTLASLSRGLRLDQFLLLGKGELLSGGSKKASILANTYEALIGAIYMDSGFDRCLEIVEGHLKRHFFSELQHESASLHLADYKSLLQDKAQRIYKQSPHYLVVNESGPDHDKRFEASVLIGGETKGTGSGKTKKEAEQEAARKALEEMGPEPQAPDSE